MSRDGGPAADVDEGDGDDADRRAGGRDREVRDVWARGALGGRERRVSVLELRAEALIGAGDVACAGGRPYR